jgi:hypothetical protein
MMSTGSAAEARLMSTEAEINARQTTADHSGRNFIISQPPAWAPNIDVETELSGEEDECEVLDFTCAVKVRTSPHGYHVITPQNH